MPEPREDGPPRYPVEAVRQLEQSGAPSDEAENWSDRIRHAWFTYLLAGVGLTVWIGLTVATLMSPVPMFAVFVLFIPVVMYGWVLQVRTLRGRDTNTGERMRPDGR